MIKESKNPFKFKLMIIKVVLPKVCAAEVCLLFKKYFVEVGISSYKMQNDLSVSLIPLMFITVERL